jgi:transcriptional regulator with XRE-family HTH domain
MGLDMRLRYYRRERGMSQRDLAALVKMAPEQLNRYEKGHSQPTLSTTLRLARALGVSVAKLLEG